MLECMTDNWYDHSASDNLYVRKMHYSETRMAGYSFWPQQGWDGLFQDLHDAVIEHGGQRDARHAGRDGGDRGRRRQGRDARPRQGDAERVPRRGGARGRLRDLDAAGVERAARRARVGAAGVVRRRRSATSPRTQLRISWVGLYMATREETFALDPREISTWLHAPTSRALSGFAFNQSAMDPTTAPDGVNLMVAGGIIPGAKATRPRLPPAHVRGLRGRPEDDVPRAEERLLAPPAPRPRPVLRRHPEARPGRHLPAPLARAERRGAVLRVRDVPHAAASASIAPRGRA